jgi:ATP-dependent DNA helicase RecG
MPHDDDTFDVGRLVEGLLRTGHELEWVEFKLNNDDPGEIGRNISAVANAAALHGERLGFIVWGIEDDTHKIVGTKFTPKTARKSSQHLEIWLTTHLTPRVDFRFYEGEIEGKRVVVLQIRAQTWPL